jgi:hypothetical protein
MTRIPILHPAPDVISEDQSLREIARRALAPPDFPFDVLDIEAALLLNQRRPEADTSLAVHPEAPSRCKTRTHPRHHQTKPERKVI